MFKIDNKQELKPFKWDFNNDSYFHQWLRFVILYGQQRLVKSPRGAVRRFRRSSLNIA